MWGIERVQCADMNMVPRPFKPALFHGHCMWGAGIELKAWLKVWGRGNHMWWLKYVFAFFWSLVVLFIGVLHVLTVLTIKMGWRSPVAKGFQGWHQLPTIFLETHWPIPIFQSELADVLVTYHHRFHHGCIGACCAGDISGFAIPWFRTPQALICNPAMGYHGTPHKVLPLKDFPIMEFHGWSCWSSFFVQSQPHFRLHLPNPQLWLWAGVRRQPSCRARMRRNTGLKEKGSVKNW